MTNVILKLQTEKMFIKKASDRTAPNVQASLVEAASKMANISGVVSDADTLDVLIDAYGLRDKQEVLDMIGMGPEFVKESIGFGVDYDDLGEAQAAYMADKTAYDSYYFVVSSAVLEKKEALEEASKTI